MSRGHEHEDGRFTAEKWEVITGAAPAGSLSSSATDMAKFMLAHLGGGALGNRRILETATCASMHARAFGHDERINGSALGFYEKSSHGLRIIGHNGDTHLFHSDLFLIPSERLGVFVSYNTSTGSALSRFAFLAEFLDHYFAGAPSPAAAVGDARAELESIAGSYAFMRRSYTTYQKVDGLSGAAVVEPTESGTLMLSSSLGTHELVRVGPMLYRDALGDSLVAFKGDGVSPATHAFLGDVPPMAMERVPWFESAPLHWFVLGFAILVFVCTLVAALRRVLRRRFGTPLAGDALPGRAWLTGLAACNLAFVLAFLALLTDPMALVTSPMTALKIVLALPAVGGLLAIGAALASVSHWRTSAGTWSARARYSGAILVALSYLWSLNVWNLLGWRM
jgi:hypothetical protein